MKAALALALAFCLAAGVAVVVARAVGEASVDWQAELTP